jgi:uncharacterized membrane protein YadS
MGVVYLILSLMMRITSGEAWKTHLYDTMPYYIQLIILAIGVTTFMVGIVQSYIRFGKSPLFVSYIIKLCFLGILAFIGMPLIILLIENNTRHNRWVPAILLPEVLKIVIFVIVSYQIKVPTSTFGKLNIHGRSFMQQGEKYL